MITDGVSIIVPAYNEAGNITDSVSRTVKAVSAVIDDYEILIVDDASTDETASIGRQLANKNRYVRYIRRSNNGGLGEAFRTGMEHVSLPFVTWFPGDGDTSDKSLKDLVSKRHSADLVMSYTVNPESRPLLRRFISWSFTVFLNLLLGNHVRYYNGCFIIRSDIVRKVKLQSTGHGIFAELKAKLLAKRIPYKEIPFYHRGRKTGATTAFRFKNIISTVKTVMILLWEVRLKQGAA